MLTHAPSTGTLSFCSHPAFPPSSFIRLLRFLTSGLLRPGSGHNGRRGGEEEGRENPSPRYDENVLSIMITQSVGLPISRCSSSKSQNLFAQAEVWRVLQPYNMMVMLMMDANDQEVYYASPGVRLGDHVSTGFDFPPERVEPCLKFKNEKRGPQVILCNHLGLTTLDMGVHHVENAVNKAPGGLPVPRRTFFGRLGSVAPSFRATKSCISRNVLR